MAIKRRRFDSDSANAAGVDYLLRRAARLDTEVEPLSLGSDFEDFRGPIERDFLVVALNSRPELIQVADYRCSAEDAEVEWNRALIAASNIHSGEGGVVIVASGLYVMGAGAVITVPIGVSLIGPPVAHYGSGAGKYALRILETDSLTFNVDGYMEGIVNMQSVGG